MTQVQGAVLAALEGMGLVPQPVVGPPGSAIQVLVAQTTVNQVESVVGTVYQVNADGSVTTAA